MARRLLLTAALFFGVPHAALAGTASLGEVPSDPKYGYTSTTLFFAAAPGERNEIVVTRIGPAGSPVFVLHDAGAPVTAAPGCLPIDERTAMCQASSVFVDAGDGDDTVTLPADADNDRHYVRGGDGSDVLTGTGFHAGGPGNDVLTCPGGPLGCVLAGGSGDDFLHGSGGDDLLTGDGDGPPRPIGFMTVLTEPGGAGNDIIDGGPGRDQVTFRGRAAGVVVDLAAGSAAGAGGERDSLAGIENVGGGEGDDLLLGDAGVNQLEGGSGNDRISGLGGNDYLLGNLVPDTNEYSVTFTEPDAGADTLRGGEGDDTLDAGSEPGDVLSGGPGADTLQDEVGGREHARKVSCGSGRDKIQFAPLGQLVSDCELLIAGGLEIRLRPQRRARSRLRFAWKCFQPGGCVTAISVRVGSSPATHRTITIQGTDSFQMRTRRAARRGDVVDITIITAAKYTPPSAARWRFRL